MTSIGEVSMNCGEKNHFARTRWVMFTEKKCLKTKEWPAIIISKTANERKSKTGHQKARTIN